MNDAADEPAPTATNHSSPRPPSRLKTLILLLISAAVLYVGWHSAVRGWELQRRFVCGQNLRGVATSMQIYYGTEWDGRTPFIQWMRSAYPGSEPFLTCPSSGSYVAVELPDGWPVDENAILAYEPKSNHKGEGGFVAYRNGVVRFITVPEFDELVASLRTAEGRNTP